MANEQTPLTSVPPIVKKSFLTAVIEWLTVLTPSLIMMRLMTMDLPPMAESLIKEFGSTALFLAVGGAFIWRFIPADTFSRSINIHQQQAAAYTVIAAVLQNLAGPNGMLEKIRESVTVIITNQGVIVTRMNELKADHVRTDAILAGRDILFREISKLLGEILVAQQKTFSSLGSRGEQTEKEREKQRQEEERVRE